VNDRLQSFDFLRGVAILGVVTFHVYAIFDPNHAAVSAVAPMGVYGVQLFYIVSALTMCLMWQRRTAEDQPALKFYIRRFFRIAPPFWLAMIGYLALNGTGPSQWPADGVQARHVLLTATFLHGFSPDTINTIVPGGWNIAVEMTFYLVFPALSAWKMSARTLTAFALAVYLANVMVIEPAYLTIFAGSQPLKDFLYFQFFYQAPIFLLGMALYRVLFDGQPKSHALLIVLAWIALAFLMRPLGLHASAFFWLLISLLLVFSWACLKYQVTFRPLNRLGELSYSVYLAHFAIIQFVEFAFRRLSLEMHSMMSFLIALSLVFLLCYIAASASQITIERWSTMIAKCIIEQLKSSYASATASSARRS
jgi:exopolysaccharide production protein ExoZ